MKPKKTFKIEDLVDRVNYLNKESVCSPEVREGWNAILQDILHQCDAYAGFNYLGQSEVPIGQAPGVIYKLAGHIYPDSTRVHWYKK
jgi:hypothetical protein